MSAGLQITLSVHRGTPRTVELGASALVGSGRAADVRVPDPALAGLHLRLVRDGAEVVAFALAPGVRGEAGDELPVDEPRQVTGRPLEIGPLRLTAEPRELTADPATRGRTESLARELVRDLMGAGAGASEDGGDLAPELLVESGPAAGQRITLAPTGERVVIGRGEHAGWVLLDPDLSRSHAAVVRGADGVRIHDLGSKNGTRIDGALAPVGPPGALLADGALIGFGATEVRFVDPAAAMLAELELRLAAVAAGTHGAITRTRPGHARAAVAVAARPAPPPPAAAAPPPPLPLAAVLAALVAVLALALLVALLASG